VDSGKQTVSNKGALGKSAKKSLQRWKKANLHVQHHSWWWQRFS